MNKDSKRDYKFKNSISKSGEFSPHIPRRLNSRLTAYCKKLNLNKTKYVIKAVEKQLHEDLMEYFNGLLKEDLINLLMEKESEFIDEKYFIG